MPSHLIVPAKARGRVVLVRDQRIVGQALRLTIPRPATEAVALQRCWCAGARAESCGPSQIAVADKSRHYSDRARRRDARSHPTWKQRAQRYVALDARPDIHSGLSAGNLGRLLPGEQIVRGKLVIRTTSDQTFPHRTARK